jgi:hypothetical protein
VVAVTRVESGNAICWRHSADDLVDMRSLGVREVYLDCECGRSVRVVIDELPDKVYVPDVRWRTGALARPAFLKRRITGGHGHLSNPQALAAIRRLLVPAPGSRRAAASEPRVQLPGPRP